MDEPLPQQALLAGEVLAVEAGEFPLNAWKPNLVSLIQAKAGAATVFGFTVCTSSAADQFVQWFDSQKAPATGDAPAGVANLPAGSTVGINWGTHGRRFLQGCWLANSSTRDTYTAGSSDCYFDAQLI